jgi:hypothetical protein
MNLQQVVQALDVVHTGPRIAQIRLGCRRTLGSWRRTDGDLGLPCPASRRVRLWQNPY